MPGPAPASSTSAPSGVALAKRATTPRRRLRETLKYHFRCAITRTLATSADVGSPNRPPRGGPSTMRDPPPSRRLPPVLTHGRAATPVRRRGRGGSALLLPAVPEAGVVAAGRDELVVRADLGDAT